MANEKKTDAWALEHYLENKVGSSGELDADTRQLVDSLQQWQQEDTLQPRSGFSQALAKELQQAHSNARRPWIIWPVLSRLLAGGVAVAALLLFGFFVSGLFRDPASEPVTVTREMATPSPTIALRGDAGMFAGVEFLLDAPLSEETEQLAAYRIEAAPLPETPEAVREMALALGMVNPRVYAAQGLTNGWVVHDDGGRRLSMDGDHVRFTIVYHAPIPTGDGRALSFAEARSRTEQFLERANLLPETYEIRAQLRPSFSLPADNVIRVEVIPTLDGHPVHYASSEVAVGADGTVVEARLLPLSFAAEDSTTTIRPARAAFEEVLAGQVTMDLNRYTQLDARTKTYFPTFSEADRGSEVTLVGYLTTLQAAGSEANGEETVIELSQHPDGAGAFRLTGAVAAETASAPLAQVRGTLEEQLPGGGWRLAVQNLVASDRELIVQCKEGILRGAGDETVFDTSEGLSFSLAYAPEAPLGEPAIVCASFTDETQNDPIAWLSITTPVEEGMLAALSSVAPSDDLQPDEDDNVFPSSVVIDWAVPGYFYTPVPAGESPGQRLEPVWLFYGHSSDETMQFVLRVPVEHAGD